MGVGETTGDFVSSATGSTGTDFVLTSPFSLRSSIGTFAAGFISDAFSSTFFCTSSSCGTGFTSSVFTASDFCDSILCSGEGVSLGIIFSSVVTGTGSGVFSATETIFVSTAESLFFSTVCPTGVSGVGSVFAMELGILTSGAAISLGTLTSCDAEAIVSGAFTSALAGPTPSKASSPSVLLFTRL